MPVIEMEMREMGVANQIWSGAMLWIEHDKVQLFVHILQSNECWAEYWKQQFWHWFLLRYT